MFFIYKIINSCRKVYMETQKVVLHNVAAPDKNIEMFSEQNVSFF